MSKREKQRSRKHVGILAVAACLVGLGVSAANAGTIPDRATLDAILGGNQILEDFESFDVPPGNASGVAFASDLDENLIWKSQGPGLVQDGAVYGGFSQWSGDGWLGLDTKQIMSSTGGGRVLTITYDSPVIAMGLDMAGLDGFPNNGATVEVFNSAAGLLDSFVFDLADSNSVFFGYESPDIGSVVLTVGSSPFVSPAIDNHGYGVPEPASLSLLAFGGLAVIRRRRR